MAIPATKNFELEKHRFFRGRFLEQSFGQGAWGSFGVSGQGFANGLQVHKRI